MKSGVDHRRGAGLSECGDDKWHRQVTDTGIGFTPTANFTGTATVYYTVTDNAGSTNHSSITVLVTNVPPVANLDFYTIVRTAARMFLARWRTIAQHQRRSFKPGELFPPTARR